jgi:hypothetical protein
MFDPLTGKPIASEQKEWLGPHALENATVLYHPQTGNEIEINGHEHQKLYEQKKLGGPFPLTRRPSTRAPRKSNLKRQHCRQKKTDVFYTKTAVCKHKGTWYKAKVPIQVLDDPADASVEVLVYPVGYEPVTVLRREKRRLREVASLPAKWTPVQYEHRPPLNP